MRSIRAFRPVLAALGLVAAGIPPTGAIPQNFSQGTGPFFGAAGVPMEEFFRNAQRWQANVVLPGEWKTEALSEGSADVMNGPGAVFGVPADSARILRKTDRSITEVTVSYSPGGSGLDRAKLLARLRTNAAAFLGTQAPAGSSPRKIQLAGRGLSVTLETGRDNVLIRMTPAPAPATTAR